ncbi:MAG: glycosyltransferase family 39 protein, partial [Anaerolineae bacterium]|nr:glycosyltransferase family 39 protein [Anaerolineae bacterium]
MTPPALSQRPPVAHARLKGLLLVLLLAAFALRLYRLDAQDIWWDEARNIDVASRPLTQIATAGELDIHPPLYFYLLHGWWRLTAHAPAPSGQDAFAVRFLSLWFGVLFVALMYALGRRMGGSWAGLGAGLTAAFLPFLIGEAQETRMYTVLLVWLAT